ncbi:MAG TPA: PQQ-binding-like beta-propeller repeat protein [Mariprofundaceae bacterium]|nr:PQQ-binding-like beta-propeller repeat protein [Mariprofundaceae bacterium]
MLRSLAVISLMLLASCSGSHSDGAFDSGATIQQIWSVDVDQRELGEPAGFSQPAVDTSRGLIVIGGRDGRVRVYDLSGREQHMITLGEASDSGALVLSNGLVAVGDVGGMLYGVDPVAGRIVWQSQLSASFLSQPVALNDGFVIQTMDNRIYHFSSTGEKRWSYTGISGGLGMYVTPSPLVKGQAVFALFSNGDAIALKAESGDLIWRRQLLLNTDAPVLSELRTPVANPLYLRELSLGIEHATDALIVSFYQGNIMMLSRSDGSQLFSKAVSIKSTPLVYGENIYFAKASGELEAIDLANGSTRWKQKLSDGELLGPVIWNGKLWLADDRGIVMRVSLDGRKESSIQLSGRIERAPVATSAGVLARTGRGVLTLLR